MIDFETASWKNFLSTGNSATTISFTESPTTLIIGKNGEGKSTLLDVLCFALYGKPFRDIRKDQIVNSINQKQTWVKVEFRTNGVKYAVIRGIKPNIFEIYADGVLLSQQAASRDYQKILESQILKMSYKTFTQVVILGSSSFTPFMKLGASARRGVVEDILDIVIFSVMGQVLKQQVSEVKTQYSGIENKISLRKVEINSQMRLISTIESSRNSNKADIQEKIDLAKKSLILKKQEKVLIDQRLSNKRYEQSKIQEEIIGLTDPTPMIGNLSYSVRDKERTVSFFTDHEICSLCSQNIDHDHKQEVVNRLSTEIQDQREKLDQWKEVESKINQLKSQLREITIESQEIQIELSTVNSSIKHIEGDIEKYSVELSAVDNTEDNLPDEKQKLKKLASDLIVIMEEKNQLSQKMLLQEVSSTLLKDSGFKAKIIQEYLPQMNKLINMYLQKQDSYIQFEIDEEFNEKIKSRYRDEFSYSSFSEGERQRIDLAILFTWRQIARMKNSASTNLLILDEVMDGSLDEDGINSAMALIDSLAADGTNVIVVSHNINPDNNERFGRILKFEKKNDFSRMVKI